MQRFTVARGRGLQTHLRLLVPAKRSAAAEVLELRYETFARDFARETRTILEFLALPWNDTVLRPQETAREKRFISTPSYSQVMEPVNNKAVGRWHSYERGLSPVLPIIQPYLERWGYEGLGSTNNK